MGDVIQFVPRPNPNRRTLEEQAVSIMNVALIGPGGIDDLIYESSLGFSPNRDKLADTTPCEYSAPADDSA